jgi:hypothetical protein
MLLTNKAAANNSAKNNFAKLGVLIAKNRRFLPLTATILLFFVA